MPTYTVTAPNGKRVTITGDSAPSEAELDDIFKTAGVMQAAPEQAAPESALSRFGSNLGETLNPVTIAKGMYQTVRHPLDTASAIYAAQGAEFDKAVDMARQGRYSEMVGHGAASLLPVIGPQAAQIGEQAGSGDIAGAAGKLVGNALLWEAPKIIGKAKAAVKSLSPEAELAKWGLEQGIPVDPASATANPIPRGLQRLSTNTSLAGAAIGTKAQKARAAALATIGEQLAAKGYAPAATRETAGAAARAGVEASIRGFDDVADQAYGALRKLEASAEAQPIGKAVPVRVDTGVIDSGGNAIVQSVPTPQMVKAGVDLKSIRPALKPVLDRLLRKKDMVGLLQGPEAKAVTALDHLVNGPDFAPLSTVDSALGQVKALARGAEMPELRSAGQGAAAYAVKQLDTAVTKAAAALGPEAVDALKTGRAATVQKYAAAELLDAINKEPVRAANAALAPKDAAIGHLRELQRFAPDALPQVGKAVLSELLGEATKDGGFSSVASLASKWDKIGPQTKQLLFKDAEHVKDLDRFFALGKKMGENPNPSGSAFVGGLLAHGYMLRDPATAIGYEIGAGTLAKLLNSPTATKLLVDGVSVPIRAKAAATARFARLTNLIQQATKSGANPEITPQSSRAQ